MLFYLTVDMLIPLLIAGVGSVCLAKSYLLPFASSSLPSCRSLMTTCSLIDVRDETSGNWPGNFSIIWGKYRRGRSSGQCCSRWKSRVKFDLTVPAGWIKIPCWTVLKSAGRSSELICISSSLHFVFISPYTCASSSSLPPKFAQILSGMTQMHIEIVPHLGDQ